MSQNDPKHRYRIALYGAKGHGKSCFLAALGCPRETNSRGHSCKRLPRTSAPEPKTKDALARGYDWVEKAEKLLLSGDVPAVTPVEEEPIALRYRFHLADKRDAEVELIDYSGELVNPDTQTSALAEVLREKMEKLDAIFVLAPHPGEGDATVLPFELHGLGSAFSLILKDRPSIPVGLIVNKWDRRGPIDHEDYEGERQDLDAFLADAGKSGGYLDLRNQLAKFSADNKNFAAFPLSAFGRYESQAGGGKKEATMDVPKLTGTKGDASGLLASFGLEDPFAWAIDRRDEIDREAAEQRAEETLRVNRWNPLSLGKLWAEAGEASRRVRGLTHRFPPNDTRLQTTGDLAGGLQKVKAFATLLCLVYAYAIWSVGDLVVGLNSYAAAAETLRDSASTESEYEEAKEWLTAYATGGVPFTWNFWTKRIRSSEEAVALIDEADENREKALYVPVEEAVEATQILNAANEYLEKYPQGRYRGEVEAAKDEAITTIAKEKNGAHLVELRQRFAGLVESKAGVREYEDLQDALAAPFPEEEAIDDETMAKRSSLKAEVAEKLKEARVALTQKERKEKYAEAMREADLLTAADYVEKLTPPPSQPHPELEDFKSRFFEKLKDKLTEHVNRRNWPEAESLTAQLKRLPSNLRPEPETYLQRILEEETRVEWAKDKYYYEAFRKRPTVPSADKYLATAPGHMKKEVEAYKDYLTTKDGKYEYTMDFTHVDWDPKAENENDFQVRVEKSTGNKIDWKMGNGDGNFQSYPGEKKRLPASLGDRDVTFTAKANEAVHFKVTITEIDAGPDSWYDSHDPHGSYKGARTPADMRKAAYFSLASAKYGAQDLYYTLTGGPGAPPALPEWREPEK